MELVELIIGVLATDTWVEGTTVAGVDCSVMTDVEDGRVTITVEVVVGTAAESEAVALASRAAFFGSRGFAACDVGAAIEI